MDLEIYPRFAVPRLTLVTPAWAVVERMDVENYNHGQNVLTRASI